MFELRKDCPTDNQVTIFGCPWDNHLFFLNSNTGRNISMAQDRSNWKILVVTCLQPKEDNQEKIVDRVGFYNQLTVDLFLM